MAKKYSTSLKRKDAFFMNFEAQKLANAIEKAGGDIKPALEKAAMRGLPIIQKEFKAFIAKHRETGNTEESLIEPSQVVFLWGKNAKKRFVGTNTKGKKGFTGGSVQTVSEEDCLFFEYGFDANESGAVALWLDIGTPKRNPKFGKVKPTYFIFYSVENNLSKIHAMQHEELTKILRGLQ